MHFELFKQLFNMKMYEEQSVHDHCITMIKDLKELEKLRLNIQRELKVDLILQSLTSSFEQFIVNCHINKLDCNLSELIDMLVTAEDTLKGSRHSILKSLKKMDEMPCEGMLIIESNLMIFSTSSWVLDSGLSTHICTSMQGLIESKRLREGDKWYIFIFIIGIFGNL